MTFSDCGMSRMSCVPRPMLVRVVWSWSRPWISAWSVTVTVPSVGASPLVLDCAQLLTEAASINAPSGKAEVSTDSGERDARADDDDDAEGRGAAFRRREIRANLASMNARQTPRAGG